MEIKIRFNTDKEKINFNLPPWRVLINGVEHLAESVVIETKCWTTQDLIEENKLKWHLTCNGEASWSEDRKVCKITDLKR